MASNAFVQGLQIANRQALGAKLAATDVYSPDFVDPIRQVQQRFILVNAITYACWITDAQYNRLVRLSTEQEVMDELVQLTAYLQSAGVQSSHLFDEALDAREPRGALAGPQATHGNCSKRAAEGSSKHGRYRVSCSEPELGCCKVNGSWLSSCISQYTCEQTYRGEWDSPPCNHYGDEERPDDGMEHKSEFKKPKPAEEPS